MGPVVAVVVVAVAAGAGGWALAFAYPRTELGGVPGIERAAARQLVEHEGWRRVLRARVDPAQATGLALTVAGAVLVAGVAFAGVVFAMVRSNTGLERWDLRLARWGAEHASARSTDVLKLVTELGSTRVVVPVAVIVAVVQVRRTHRRSAAAFLALAVVGQNVVVNITKFVVDRARPDIDRLAGFSGPSFPSGHSAAAATTYAAIALLLGSHRSLRVRAVLSGAAAAVAAAVAASRVLLGVHWFTDVLAGVAIGWAWFALSAIAFGGRLLQFGGTVEAAERVVATEPTAAAPARDG